MNIGCSICHHTFADAKECVATACGHLFDRDCISQWMQSHRRPSKCPTCRQNIGALNRIYFTTIPDGSSVKKNVLQLQLQVAEKEKTCLRGRNFYLYQKYFNLFTTSKEQEYAHEQLQEEVKKLKEENGKLKIELEKRAKEGDEQKKLLEDTQSTNKKLEEKIIFIKEQYLKNDDLKNKYLSLAKEFESRKDYYKKLSIDYRIQINDLFQDIERLRSEIALLDMHRDVINPFCEDAAITKLEHSFLKKAQNEMKFSVAAVDPYIIGKRMASLLQAYANQFVLDAGVALKNLEPLLKKYGGRSSSFSSSRNNRSGIFKSLNRVPMSRSSTRNDLTSASGFDDWPWEI